MERLQRLFGAAAAGHQPGMDTPTVDNAEMVYISSLALLKVSNIKDIVRMSEKRRLTVIIILIIVHF